MGQSLNYEVQEVGAVEKDGEIVSSSRIRKLLEQGEIERAARFLGRPFALPGKVVRGVGRGRSIGIPTANLEIWPKRAVPAPGVYVCVAWLGERKWPAVTNIGVRPTFEDELLAPVVESHFLDYDGEDFYGQNIRLEFLTRLRDEQRFPNVDALTTQIQQDISEARKIFAKDSEGIAPQ
jgi:riboflavin kinase/FMN adenylyltransferase